VGVRLLLVDDHELFREGLALWLGRLDGGAAVRTADDLDSALVALASQGPFDLVVSDLMMPGMEGVTGLERLCAAAAPASVLVLSARRHPFTVTASLQAGAQGYLPKEADGATVLDAARRLLDGQTVLPPGMDLPEATLSPRQLTLLRCLAEGMPNKVIAATLHLSEGTVKQYLNELYLCLGVQNRSQAALEAREILALGDH